MTIGRIRAMAREHSEGAGGSGADTLRIERHHRGSGVHVDIVGEIDAASSGAFSDELLDAAEKGTLRTPAGLEKQVRRMLGDARSETLMRNFGHTDCGIYGEVIAGGEIAPGDAVTEDG